MARATCGSVVTLRQPKPTGCKLFKCNAGRLHAQAHNSNFNQHSALMPPHPSPPTHTTGTGSVAGAHRGPSKKPTVFRWGPPPPRSNRANLRRKDFFFAASKRHFFLRLGSVGWGGIRWGVPDRTNQRDFGGVRLPRPGYPTGYRDPSLVISRLNERFRTMSSIILSIALC